MRHRHTSQHDVEHSVGREAAFDAQRQIFHDSTNAMAPVIVAGDINASLSAPSPSPMRSKAAIWAAPV